MCGLLDFDSQDLQLPTTFIQPDIPPARVALRSHRGCWRRARHDMPYRDSADAVPARRLREPDLHPFNTVGHYPFCQTELVRSSAGVEGLVVVMPLVGIR